MSAITFENVTKKYGAVTALDRASIDIARGEMFGVIGPDGAGKTTAIRVACGLMPVDGGRVTVLGRDPLREHRAVTHQIGYLSQRFSLYGDLTIDENIAFFAEIHGVSRYHERARPAALHDAADTVSWPARRSPVGGDEAEAGARLHARP